MSNLRHAFEAVLTVLLFTLQNIVYGGYTASIMAIPLFAYILAYMVEYPNLERDLSILLFFQEFIVGRVIALIGFVILLMAGIQLLRGYVKRVGLVKTGLYSVVRHPQYTGIVVMTLGLTVMVLTLKGNVLQPIFMWLVQIIGYIALARYEEWRLEKKHGESYRQYKGQVPFMFPIKCPSHVPEVLFTILVSVIISFFLFLFPYELIRLH